MDLRQIQQELDRLYEAGKLALADEKLNGWLREALDSGNSGAALMLYNEMEGLYRVTGREKEGAAFSEKALLLIDRMGLKGTSQHATTLLNGAAVNRAAGNPERALRMYREAEEIYRALGEVDTYYMASLYNNISQIYRQQGQPEQALSYLQKAQRIIDGIAPDSEEAATSRVNTALALMALGRLEEAEQALSSGLAYYQGKGGQSGHYSAALAAAGELAFRQKRYPQAVAHLESALELTLSRFGECEGSRVIRANLAAVRACMDSEAL